MLFDAIIIMFGVDEYNYHNTFTGDCFKGQYEICTKNRGGKYDYKSM